MFPIHETNRRLLCRVIFLVLVPAPTLAVAAWCGARHLPGHTAAYEDRLSAALGVRVEIDVVTHPLPGKTVLHGVKLFDAEQGAEIASCDELSITNSEETLLITADQATIKRKHFGHGWEALHARLRRPDMLPAKTRIIVGSLRVDVSYGYETLERVDLNIRSYRSGVVQLRLAFGLFDMVSDEPIRVEIDRNRQAAPPATHIVLRTGPTALPCSLLSLTGDGLSALGPKSRFRGVASIQQTSDGWQCRITGECTKIDLKRLVTEQFPPHELSGLANIRIESTDPEKWGAELINGRIVRADGFITAKEGRVGGSLIGALEQHLNIPPVYPKQFPAQDFEWLRAAFTLNEEGLSIRGPTRGGGSVIVDESNRPLLGQVRSPQPLAGLLNALLPEKEPAARAYLEAILPRPALLR
ncbi:MAG: hypothetical protein IID44_28080 [Planctomycetes bacterium]|nr:hypothetical protein [Planctomycetota bacterium]